LSYDLYATIPCQTQGDVNNIVSGQINGQAIPDIYTRIQVLAPALLREERWNLVKGKDYAHHKYRDFVFRLPDHTQTDYTTKLIAKVRDNLMSEGVLGLWQPAVPDLTALPSYSAFLQFRFILASPYLSRDDEVFHINDNPVRKDKVFKIPMVAGTTWKGNLRWTAVHLAIQKWQSHQDADTLAAERFHLARLFGDEKGEEGTQVRDLAKYLDEQSSQAARLYRLKVRNHFSSSGNNLPHHSGRLRFYPTFYDRIGLEVINPHERATRAGKQPIYFESVPVGASGVFSLLYVPFDGVAEAEARRDMTLAADAIREMMLTYGFSAKKSRGFGEAQDDIAPGQIVTATGPWPLTKLFTMADVVGAVTFSHQE
jgi:CRISPR-associated protein Cmr2